MLWTILVVLLLLWALGFFGGFVTSNLVHLLLVVALVVLVINLFSGRRTIQAKERASLRRTFRRQKMGGQVYRCCAGKTSLSPRHAALRGMSLQLRLVVSLLLFQLLRTLNKRP